MNPVESSQAPWIGEAPVQAGAYDFRCGETDGKIERVTVYAKRGFLWIDCPDTGTHVVKSYHDGLTRTEWRLVAAAQARKPKKRVKQAALSLEHDAPHPPAFRHGVRRARRLSVNHG